MKSLEKTNPAYVYVLLCSIALLAEMITGFGNAMAVVIGLGLFNIIYILNKILKKL